MNGNRSLLEKSVLTSLATHGALVYLLFRFTVGNDVVVQPQVKIIRARIVRESPPDESAFSGYNEDGTGDAGETKGKIGMPEARIRDGTKFTNQKTVKYESPKDSKVISKSVASPIVLPNVEDSHAKSQDIDSRQKDKIEMKHERLPDFNSLNIALYKQDGNKPDSQPPRNAQKRNPSIIITKKTDNDDVANRLMENSDGGERQSTTGDDGGTYGKSESGEGIGSNGGNGDGAKRCPLEMVLIPEHDGLAAFCIDRFEYPNVKGGKPKIGVSLSSAIRFCASSGKRLCYDNEWTEACHGVSRTAFPYGNKHVKQKCNTDNIDGLAVNGKYKECVSDYHVYDLIGNVWEWVLEENTENGSLRGGSFADSGISGCSSRTADRSTKINIRSVGFRCCR